MKTFPLRTPALITTVLYALLVIPTVLMLVHVFHDSGASVSASITQSWQAAFWQIPGLSAKVSRTVADIAVIVIALACGRVYVQGYRILRRQPVESPEAGRMLFGQILIWSAIFALTLSFVVPFHSQDLYGYINRGAQQVFYLVNPYAVTVSRIPNWQADPIFHAHWLTNPCPYGFFFTQLAQLLAGLSGHDFWLAFLIFKDFSVLVHLATVWMLYELARKMNMQKPWLPAYLYGWNPLMLLHLIANGHNDGLLALMLLCALWPIVADRHLWAALPALTLSVLTKYASLLAGPFVVVYFAKRRAWPPLIFGLMFSVMLVVLLGWPYLQDPSALPWERMAGNAACHSNSLHSALARSVYYMALLFTHNADATLTWARALFKWMLWGGFAFIYGWVLLSFGRDRQTKETIRPALVYDITLVMTMMITLASAKFNVWYVGMIFPLLLLLDNHSRLRQFGLLLTLFQLLAFTPLENLHIASFVVLIFAPLVLTRYTTLFREEAV